MSNEASSSVFEKKLGEIDMKRYLDVKYDKADLFKRALYVFRSSYFG